MCCQFGVVSLCRHHGNLKGSKATIGVRSGDKKIPLNVVRPYRIRVLSYKALDMSGSPHLTIGYLPRINMANLKFNSHG